MRAIPSSIAPRVPVSLQHFGVPLGVSGNCPAGDPPTFSGVLVLVAVDRLDP